MEYNAQVHACAGILKSTSDFSCSVHLGYGHHVAGNLKNFVQNILQGKMTVDLLCYWCCYLSFCMR